MLSALKSFDILDDVDEEKSYLLHAHLACLLDGRREKHIDDEAYGSFLTIMRNNLLAATLIDDDDQPTGARLRAEPMWLLFSDAVTQAAETVHPCGRRVALADTRDSNSQYSGVELMTIGRLEFTAELARRGAAELGYTPLQKVSRADIVRNSGNRAALALIVECCNYALANGLINESEPFKVDLQAITWITPVEDMAAMLVARADAFGLTKKDITSLRNLLGLWAENGRTKRPLAAFFLDCSAGLAAPNVFTAMGYERFRHRPPAEMVKSPNTGLTYNMDRASAPAHPGACEIVSDAIVLPQVKRVEAGGHPSRFRPGRTAELTSHRVYSEEAHRGRSINTILDELEALVP